MGTKSHRESVYQPREVEMGFPKHAIAWRAEKVSKGGSAP